MHSLIIQLQNEIDPNNIISESDYNFDGSSGDLCPFADYYSSINERHRRQILDELSLHGIAINGDTFTITDKSVYFKDYYINFKKNLKLLSSVNEDDFISDNYTVDGNMHSLNKEYNDRYGIYVDDKGDYFSMTTLARFLRHYNNGDTFQIGGLVDYHC